MIFKKNIKLGNKLIIFLILFIFSSNLSFADDKITSTPLINLEKIKPSFEEPNEENENSTTNQNLKEKKKLTNF